ncbi:acyl carrier protein [Kushneria sinocarnis]|uniref:Acyl carrier protein n=1 Tax=Kushneria sinocarnis TaxID=595502 RepID=A0A420X004_9GAMM|nr:acyl carrier protein [Kushneria sinocarnis]RKR06948.1 acyl carrier protein [Kushneria sinocarnis]
MTRHEQILERLMQHLERFKSESGELHADADLINELGLDSVNVMDMLLEIEDEFDISVPINMITDVRTPRQLADVIVKIESGE